MAKLINDTLLKALLRKKTSYTPIWIMRQAGRYLPEYKKTRTQAGDFLKLCKSIDLATEVTMQPLERFDLDAAIVFSDILTIPDAMDLGLYFSKAQGPKFKKALDNEYQINHLEIPDMSKLQYVFDIVSNVKKKLNGKVPLIGFSGSPFTLACYMIEGGSSKDFFNTKKMIYSRPDLMHKILKINSQTIINYLNEQIKAGVQAIQIFDTWGGILTYDSFKEFSLNYIKYILKNLISEYENNTIPTILFVKGGSVWLEDISNSGTNAVSIDWNIPISWAKIKVNNKVAIQGNLDPVILFADDNKIKQEVSSILYQYSKENGHVFNLGHGINQYTEIEKVKLLIDTVHQESKKYHM